MNALFYLASGTGPHPTLLLLHGFPGYEQISILPRRRGATAGTS